MKEDPRTVYTDIIDLLHHEPDPIKHPRMSLYNRAAQFEPFAALSGYDEMVAEETRVTDVDHMRSLEPDDTEVVTHFPLSLQRKFFSFILFTIDKQKQQDINFFSNTLQSKTEFFITIFV